MLEGNKDFLNPGNNCIVHENEENPDEFVIFGHLIDRQDRYLPGKRLNKRKMFRANGKYDSDSWPIILP